MKVQSDRCAVSVFLKFLFWLVYLCLHFCGCTFARLSFNLFAHFSSDPLPTLRTILGHLENSLQYFANKQVFEGRVHLLLLASVFSL